MQKSLCTALPAVIAKLMLATLFTAGVAHAIPISGQGTWESTLQGRDINHDGVTDAYYDTSLHISWLADANYAATSGFSATGQMLQPQAIGWASGLDVYGVTGWRLAGSNFSDAHAACPTIGLAGCRYVPSAAVDEFAHLYYVTLGNSTHDTGMLASNNTGSFLNVMGQNYDYNTMPDGFSSAFSFATGRSLLDGQQLPQFAWAVHDGDISGTVSPVPEPQTYALMLLGLVMVGTVVRKTRAANRRNL
ncbi:MAG TPA: PEP-CTERM sorting domain-containing protein [Rhizobacter sp.]|nr:PEP-CTERM sorting domain-containing protein [Rhizobacter sp.]